MAFTLRGTTEYYHSGSSDVTTAVINVPAGSQAGDIAIVQGYVYAKTITPPSGWMTLFYGTGGNCRSVYARVLTADDISAGSWTFTFSGTYAKTIFACQTFYGDFNADDPVQAVSVAVNDSDTTTYDSWTEIPVTGRKTVAAGTISLVLVSGSYSYATTYAPPAGHTAIYDGGNSNWWFGHSIGIYQNAGTNPGTLVVTPSYAVRKAFGIQILLNPPGATTPVATCRGTETVATSSNSATHTVPKPEGTVANDTAVAIACYNKSDGVTITPPSGFLERCVQSTSSYYFHVYTRVVSEDEGDWEFGFDVTGGKLFIAVHVYGDLDGFQAIGTPYIDTYKSSLRLASMTTGETGAMSLFLAGTYNTSAITHSQPCPWGYREDFNGGSSAPDFYTIATSKVYPTADTATDSLYDYIGVNSCAFGVQLLFDLVTSGAPGGTSLTSRAATMLLLHVI